MYSAFAVGFTRNLSCSVNEFDMSRFHDCSLNPSRRITRCTSIRYYRTCMKFMLQNLTISRWFQNLIVIRGCQLNVWIEGMIECWDSSTFVSCASNAVLQHLCYFVRVLGVCSFHSFTQIRDFCARARKRLVIAMSLKNAYLDVRAIQCHQAYQHARLGSIWNGS